MPPVCLTGFNCAAVKFCRLAKIFSKFFFKSILVITMI